ncbi:nuclear transport factor 2 family protein [Algicola sagamiensis]|uniref:nuclear transport factor 2 family protein n=1 Tax=Algicola sagamiensis TaxID=163869 RepID=UPI00036BA1CC|nr:nuclear transport factor 2 family protein [Algicola sagamiensis]
MPVNDLVIQFFEKYSKAYASYDLESVVSMFYVPSLLMSDDDKLAVTSTEILRENTELVLQQYKDLNVASIKPNIQHVLKLSASMWFTTLEWHFYDDQENELYDCRTSYTLQKSGENLKILAVVVDDEKDAYAKAVNKMQQDR